MTRIHTILKLKSIVSNSRLALGYRNTNTYKWSPFHHKCIYYLSTFVVARFRKIECITSHPTHNRPFSRTVFTGRLTTFKNVSVVNVSLCFATVGNLEQVSLAAAAVEGIDTLSGVRISFGRLFHAVGPATANCW